MVTSKWKEVGKKILKGAAHYATSKALGATIGESAEAGYQGQHIKSDDEANAADTELLTYLGKKDIDFDYKYGVNAGNAKIVGSLQWEKDNKEKEIGGFEIGPWFTKKNIFMPKLTGTAEERGPFRDKHLLRTWREHGPEIIKNEGAMDSITQMFATTLSTYTGVKVDSETGKPMYKKPSPSAIALGKMHPRFQAVVDNMKGDTRNWGRGYTGGTKTGTPDFKNGSQEIPLDSLDEADQDIADKHKEMKKNPELWSTNQQENIQKILLKPNEKITPGSEVPKGFLRAKGLKTKEQLWHIARGNPGILKELRQYTVYNYLDLNKTPGAYLQAALYHYIDQGAHGGLERFQYTFADDISLINGIGIGVDRDQTVGAGLDEQLIDIYRPYRSKTLGAQAAKSMASFNAGIMSGKQLMNLLVNAGSKKGGEAILAGPGKVAGLLDFFNSNLKGFSQFHDIFGRTGGMGSRIDGLENTLDRLRNHSSVGLMTGKNERASYDKLVGYIEHMIHQKGIEKDNLLKIPAYQDLQQRIKDGKLDPQKNPAAYQLALQKAVDQSEEMRKAMARASFNTLRVMFAFQAAVALQGGAGGRTVSDQDFERLQQALSIGNWSTIEQAQTSVSGILRFMEEGRNQAFIIQKFAPVGTHVEVQERYQKLKGLIQLNIVDASGKSTMETHNEYGNFMPKLYGAMSTLKMQQQAGTKANVPDLLYKLLNDSIDPETRGHLGLIQ